MGQVKKVVDVFVAGGQPTVTYNPRSDHDLEGAMREYFDTGYKLLSVSGQTKSGKTVLARKFLPRKDAFWIYGGQIDTIDKFWEVIVEKGDTYTNTSSSSTEHESTQTDKEHTGNINTGLFGSSSKQATRRKSGTGSQESRSRSVSPSVAATSLLEDRGKPIVIDDFHYIDADIQKSIIRSLKNLIFDGLNVIVLSVPHRAYDAVRVEREMTGRVMQLKVPKWSEEELRQIAFQGFNALNLTAKRSIVDRLIEESFRSPHLMQDFCNALCRVNGVHQETENKRELRAPTDWEEFFRARASATSKSAFDRLSRGPRQRSDRMQRSLRDGGSCDIYEAVLYSIAETGPRTKLSYEEIRAAMRRVLADNVPQAHEITRVLGKMSEISSDDIQGEPVVDWDSEMSELHISDPYFAYYLRWGAQQ